MSGINSSIFNDVKHQFQYGTMINKLILVNIFFFIGILIFKVILSAIGPAAYASFLDHIGVVNTWHLILRPWTLITYMFSHEGFLHILFNLIWLYVFGFAISTFFKDRQIFGLYILGGLAGAISYIVVSNLVPSLQFGGVMIGASASVMAILLALTAISPDYRINLLLIGAIKIKYIALALVFFDLLGIAAMNNTGGHFAHLGGALFGLFYVKQLRSGRDLTDPVSAVMDKIANFFKKPAPKRGPKIVYRNQQKAKAYVPPQKQTYISQPGKANMNKPDIQEKINSILDKIGMEGYDSLTADEKEFLFRFKDES